MAAGLVTIEAARRDYGYDGESSKHPPPAGWCLPPPCGEGLRVGVPRVGCLSLRQRSDPHPCPSPQGGGETAETRGCAPVTWREPYRGG
jgi:hypothetical protein